MKDPIPTPNPPSCRGHGAESPQDMAARTGCLISSVIAMIGLMGLAHVYYGPKVVFSSLTLIGVIGVIQSKLFGKRRAEARTIPEEMLLDLLTTEQVIVLASRMNVRQSALLERFGKIRAALAALAKEGQKSNPRRAL